MKIAEARQRAEDFDSDELASKYLIDWSKVSSDKRHGNVYGWDVAGAFLGQFRNHAKAVEAGAHVTRMGVTSTWFIWPAKPVGAGNIELTGGNCGYDGG